MKNSDTENDKTVPQAAGSAPDTEELIAPGTPIQFDIVLPASEFLDQNRGSRYGLKALESESQGVSLLTTKDSTTVPASAQGLLLAAACCQDY